MRKMVAIILVVAMCASVLALPASAEGTDLLEQQFQAALSPIDESFDFYGNLRPYMIRTTNDVILKENSWEKT